LNLETSADGTKGTIRPHLEYGSIAWITTAKTNQEVFEKVQSQVLRVITVAIKSTPIKAMDDLTAIPPLGHRREEKTMIQVAKYQYLPDLPMTIKLCGLTKNRLRRSSFIHESKQLVNNTALDLDQQSLL
jgi:hypothetical protein